MKLQGGMSMDAVKFHPDVREVAIALIDCARELVELPMEAERGVRFNYTPGVLWRAESMFSEDDFLREPLRVVFGALIDAARSDYWYSHEKDYSYETEVEDEYESESDAC